MLLGASSVPARADTPVPTDDRPLRVDILGLLGARTILVASASPVTARIDGRPVVTSGLRIDAVRGGLRVRAASGRPFPCTSIEIGSDQDVLTVDITGRNRRSRSLHGPLGVSIRRGTVACIAPMALEDLVASAVAAEMDGATEPAALDAAAVAIRSYLVGSRGRHARDGFDVCDSTHCVHSTGLVDRNRPTGIAAFEASRRTSGLVLVRDGRVVAGYVTACCGGCTTTPAVLWGSDDRGDYAAVSCTSCEASPFYRWRRTIRANRLAGALRSAFGADVRDDLVLRVDNGPDGWIRSVFMLSGRFEQRVGADAFRFAVGRRVGWDVLPSTNFGVERERGAFVFRGRGFGHGIGLCLAGARASARAGASRDGILQRYFPLERVAPLPRPSTGV